MKTIIIIETVEELLRMANPNRTQENDYPFLGTNAKLIFENNFEYIQLQGADGFELSQLITFEKLLTVLFNEHHLKIHIT